MHKALVMTAAIWLCLDGGRRSSAGELADVAVEAHDAAIQAIRSYSAEVDFRGNVIAGVPTAQYTTAYWRTPDGVRIREVRDQRNIEISSRDDKVEVIVTSSGATPTGPAALRILPKHSFVTHADPWLFSLFSIPGGATPSKPAPDRTLTEVHRLFELKEESSIQDQGRDLVLLRYLSPVDRQEYRIFLDKRWNWLVVRVQRDHDTGSDLGVAHYDYSAADFVEIKPGIFAPTRCTLTYRAARGPAITNEATIKTIRMNDASIQLPPFAAPAKDHLVLDRTKGITYQANAQQQRVGKISKVGEPFDLPGVPVEYKLPATRWTEWLIAASVAAGLAAGFFAWFKLRPHRSA